MARVRIPISGPRLFGAGFGPLPGVNDLALPGATLAAPHGTSDLYTHDKPPTLHPLRAESGDMPGMWRVPTVAEQWAAMREELMPLVPLGRNGTPERSIAYLNLAAQLPTPAATRGPAMMIAAGPDDHEPLPALEENGGATPDVDGEFSSTTPDMLYAELEHQLAHVHARLAGLHTQLAADVHAEYSAALADLAERLAHWHAALQELPHARGLERKQYADDIVIGERCLLDRLVRVSADIFSEPIDEDATSGWGLRTRTRKPRVAPTPRLRPTPTAPDAALPALVNHDIGFGPTLMLRPHQIADVNRFRGALRVVHDRVATLPVGATLPVELLQGTVVLPVGGGKTLEMIACCATALAEGWWKPVQGDKVIILNHTEQIHEQNLKVAQRLAPYFQQRTGRALRVSEYKADSKDCMGDVVVVSIPSVNTPERLAAFVATLQAELGSTGHLALAAVDEIHHLELGRGKTKESWRAIIKALRKIAPHLYRIGFTATPTGREGPYLGRLRELDLMRAGVTPRTYVVKVPGVDLSQLKVSEAAADFNTKQLVSTQLDFPERTAL